jgi:hypothetical protein
MNFARCGRRVAQPGLEGVRIARCGRCPGRGWRGNDLGIGQLGQAATHFKKAAGRASVGCKTSKKRSALRYEAQGVRRTVLPRDTAHA